MKPLSMIASAVIAASCLAGCKKNGGTSNNSSVYLAGIDNNQIVYWKDGREVSLATVGPGNSGSCSGIAVLDGDVYVTGYVGDTAVYWKNGVEIRLSDPTIGPASATALTTSGPDIYIAGFGQTSTGYEALYWKNGVKTVVTTSANPITAVTITVSGADVYIAATIGSDTAVFWKNGVRSTLASNHSYARGIALSEGSVYVSGTDNGAPVFWKDGKEYALDHAGSTSTNKIVVSGTDVYIAGEDGENAVYWHNGTEQILGTGLADAIAVSGSDVYVAGLCEPPTPLPPYALYWKNGSMVEFTGPLPSPLPAVGFAITLATR
jgi:hypothetical protein